MTTLASGKAVIYQVFTRLFGNKVRTNKPWGTLEENGCGKFNDFNDTALAAIKSYGVSHIWYTGVLHHALIRSYPGISDDHPSIVKGRAGSPYAIKDYYNVNPDLAENVEHRLDEFKALIERSHKHGLKVIIDIVPNHVARNYHSISAPEGVRDFGADDDTSQVYQRNNNFYYLPGEAFITPEFPEGLQPLGGEPIASDYHELPAKWTGNGARSAQPGFDDWYETAKINYGVTPDGDYDFPRLPDFYREQDFVAHHEFWRDQDLPSSWYKFRDIAHYWLDLGVDGFRFDMAEMVPVEFWSFLNSSIKMRKPSAEVIAEVYQPHLYRDYLSLGKMDYLYDKVDLYDTLKTIVQGKQGCSAIDADQAKLADIDHQLLRFLENHDEQRIAHREFAGSAQRGWPAMIVTTLIGQGPTMLYFGQAQGEAAEQDLGFGRASRTTIFDYAGVPAHQAWMNQGKFDGGGLTGKQQQLDAAYQRLLSFSAQEACLNGEFISLHAANLADNSLYDERQYAFIRHLGEQWLIVLVNFDDEPFDGRLLIPEALSSRITELKDGLTLHEQIGTNTNSISVKSCSKGFRLQVHCPALNGLVFRAAPESTT